MVDEKSSFNLGENILNWFDSIQRIIPEEYKLYINLGIAIIAIIIFVLLGDRIISDTVAPGYILFIAAVIVGSIRITAYYTEDLSKDLAKLFPFTILAIALVSPGFFKRETLSAIWDIGSLLGNVVIYLLVIVLLEFVLRMLTLISPEEKTNKK